MTLTKELAIRELKKAVGGAAPGYGSEGFGSNNTGNSIGDTPLGVYTKNYTRPHRPTQK